MRNIWIPRIEWPIVVVIDRSSCHTKNQSVSRDKKNRQNLCSFGRFLSLQGMIIGYARVNTDDQRLDSQTDALSAADTKKIFADKIGGSKRVRPELNKMLDQLRGGDVVIVTKYDPLARSLKDLLEIVEAIRERGAGFCPWPKTSTRRRQPDDYLGDPVSMWCATGGWGEKSIRYNFLRW